MRVKRGKGYKNGGTVFGAADVLQKWTACSSGRSVLSAGGFNPERLTELRAETFIARAARWESRRHTGCLSAPRLDCAFHMITTCPRCSRWQTRSSSCCKRQTKTVCIFMYLAASCLLGGKLVFFWRLCRRQSKESPCDSPCSRMHLHYGLSTRRYQHESAPPDRQKLLKISSGKQFSSEQQHPGLCWFTLTDSNNLHL